MSTTVTEKSTKATIWEAYNEALKRVEELEALKMTPEKAMENQRVTDAEFNAEKIIDRGILNDQIAIEYSDLKDTIARMKSHITELYDIEAKAGSLVALQNTYNIKAVELKEEFEAKKRDLNASFNISKDEINMKIEDLKDEYARLKQHHTEEERVYKSNLDKQRAREEEEYTYNLSRSHAKQDDAWNDEKETREKELRIRELDIAKRESEIEEMSEYIADLEEKVNDFPNQLAEAIKKAKEEGKSEASKSYAFEKRFLEKDNENKINILETKMGILEEQLVSTQRKLTETENKLSEAYVQVQTIATESVKSSGGVKILSSDNQK